MMAARKAASSQQVGFDHIGQAGGCPPVLDLVHLSHQTFGDEALERDILQLFSSQAHSTANALKAARDARERARLYHLIKGSARGVGAFQLASLASTGEDDPACDEHLDATLEAISAAAKRVDQLL